VSARKPPGRKKRAASRTGTTKKVARKTASKPARKSATKRATPKRVAGRRVTKKPAPLKVVRGRFARPRVANAKASAPAFPQTKNSTSKQKLLFELVRARVGVHAAVQGLQPGSAEDIARPGRWSVRRHILHLIVIDRAVLNSIEGALLGTVPAWARLTPAQTATFEQQEASPLLHLDWAEALRRLHASRDHLMEALESIPDDPASVWEPGHPFAELLTRVITGDREQAEVIKHWRTSRRESPAPA
jgi:hypothetical protein